MTPLHAPVGATPTETDVLIVGAGPTGLTAATLLARHGVDFRIVDRGDGPTSQSRAFGVQARTLELWDKLGIADGAIRDGIAVDTFNLLTERTAARGGRPLLALGREDQEVTPYPFLLILEQYKTERLLVADLETRAADVEWGTELLSLTSGPDAVDAVLRSAATGDERVSARYVIGADGAHSVVRRALGIGFEGVAHDTSIFIADIDIESPLEGDRVYIDATGRGLGLFPMRGDGGEHRYRLISSVPESWGDDASVAREDVQRLLDDESVATIRIIDAPWISTFRVHTRMAERFRAGRVFLAGDAAHIHSPAGGQGMNTGIQDAWNLAWKLALVLRGAADERLLESYAPERMPVARAILRNSDAAFALVASPRPLMGAFRRWILPLLPSLTLRSGVRARTLRAFAQTWIDYRDSDAVAGDRSGRIAVPGDRAPHARLASGASVFSLLRDTGHHALLFADAGRADLDSLLRAYALEVHVHLLDPSERRLYRAYGVTEPTLILVRPDGHIAWRGRADSLDAFRGYLDRLYLRRAVERPGRSRRSTRALA